jgi:hypothetical protein
MPISRTIRPIGQRINRPRFINAAVLCAAGSSGTPQPLNAKPGDGRRAQCKPRRQSPGIRADIDLSCAEAAPTNRLRSDRSDALRRRSAGSTKVWRAATVSADLTLGVGVVEVGQHCMHPPVPRLEVRAAGPRAAPDVEAAAACFTACKGTSPRWCSALGARAAPIYGVISASCGAGECQL